MIPAIETAKFRVGYSVPSAVLDLVPWADSELNQMSKTLLQVHSLRAAWGWSPCFCQYHLCCLKSRPACRCHTLGWYRCMQSLTTHIEQLFALPDELLQTTMVQAAVQSLWVPHQAHRALLRRMECSHCARVSPIAQLLSTCE
jgi:hypothetical protein